MKNNIIAILLLLHVNICLADNTDNDYSQPFPSDDEIQQVDYEVAMDFGFSKQDLDRARRKVKANYNSEADKRTVATSMPTPIAYARMTDRAIGNMIKKAETVLKYKGFDREAKQITTEYKTYYKTATVDYLTGNKALGDHPPLSKWLTIVHEKIEGLIGSYLCKYFHLHDIYIFNYTVPVVFAPELYKEREYLVHFAGRHQVLFMWDHHGLAGVVTYWIVNIACSAGTSGMGAVAFVCGPVSDLAEHYMDLDIAPPIGTKIWENHQHEKNNFCSDTSLRCQ